ncbi:MAG: ABC transporter ATP-binding protein [Deltaproteobacteria bacterium]|nr:MAG: ABC transporter ATP-binding protein [Deltaproteobacteria bacterium]
MIRVENLSKSYRGIHALKGVNFHVPAGELFAYLGPNGAGKTTTIRILTGLTRRSAGNAWLNGFNIEKEGLAAKREFGMVMQSINLDQELTTFENLDIHGRIFHMAARERRKKIDELLSYVDLIDRRNDLVKQLSGGMKRRLTIARALVHSPRILFLDEPTVGLDPQIRRRIWGLIKRIQHTGTTIFLTTHYIEEAEFLADRVAFLDEGRVVATDTPAELMAQTGAWAIDRINDDKIETVCFKTRHDAGVFIAGQKGSYTLRRVNLEDSFLTLTGKRVQC